MGGPPVGASVVGQFRVEQAVRLVQVDHVVGGVLELRFRQGPAQPVRARLAFFQRDAGDLLDEFLVAEARAEPGHRRRDLGIEQGRWHDAAAAQQGLQVLAGAVHELGDRRILQQGPQGIRNAGRGGIHEQDFAGDRQLHQRQLRVVGPFANELGVERDQGMPGPGLQAGAKRLGGVDPVAHGVL